MLWAGSVEMMRTLSRTAANWTAKLQLHTHKGQVSTVYEGQSTGHRGHQKPCLVLFRLIPISDYIVIYKQPGPLTPA